MTTSTDPASGGRLAHRAVRAIAWNYTSWFATKLLVLVATAVLARLLTPEEFGVVGFATVAIAYLSVLQDLGLGAALIQRREDVEDAADTIFTLNLVVGASLALLTALGAPAVARFFGEPQVEPMLRILGLGFILNAIGSTHITLLQRRLEFSKKVVPDVGRSLVTGIVSIAAAAAGLGPWALVIGHLAGSVTGTALAWVVNPWRPRLRVVRRLVRPLVRFGGPLLGVDLVHAMAANLDYLIVGKVLGSSALGIYTLAYRLPELLLIGVVTVLNKAVFPAFAAVQDRPEALRRGFLASMEYVPMVVVPIGLGLMIAAEPIVIVTLGDTWLDAVPVMRVLAAFAMVSSLMVADGDVYKALGRPGMLARFAAAKALLLIPALLIAVHHGLIWVAAAHLSTTLIVKAARAVTVTRMIDIGMGDLLTRLRPSLIAGAALSAASLAAMTATSGTSAVWPSR